MRKVKGYDLFFLACDNSILVVQFKNLEFQVLNYLENVVQGLIFELGIFGSYVIPLTIGMTDTKLKVVKFGPIDVKVLPSLVEDQTLFPDLKDQVTFEEFEEAKGSNNPLNQKFCKHRDERN